MNQNDLSIRLEAEADHRQVECLVRDAFWNVYRPGCLEHYVLHTMRTHPAFIPELNFVLEKDGEIIGQNVFVRAVIQADGVGEIPIAAMGPICIAPAYQRQGYGKSCWTTRWSGPGPLASGPCALRETLPFTARAASGMPVSSACAIRGCPRARTLPSSCAGSWRRGILPESPASTHHRRVIWWTRKRRRCLTEASRRRKSGNCPVSFCK